MEITRLYDMFLVGKYISELGTAGSAVVPNDVRLGAKREGLLIRGKNNSGKTVYLRSAGTAQIFAQSGLPITAKSARISARNGIYAQFSRAEESFTQNDSAGRFEAEVRDIARIIGEIEPNSLLLLNETFQTTAFSEAAEAMRDILEAVSRAGVKWIFVTHLLKLIDLLPAGNGVVFMKTSEEEGERYKLKEYMPTEDA